MSFSQFIKPYPDGYEDFEVGGTPVTAEILNTNYDGFLLGLNEFLPELAGMVEANPSEAATAGNLTKLKVGNSIYLVPSGGSGGSTVEWEQLQLTGTKIATITIDNVPVDVYAPSGGGSGDEVEWTQTIGSGTKIGTITINGNPTDVYAPTPIDVEANPSDSATAGDLTKLKVGSSIYSIPSGGGTGGHTIIDENDNSMTARAGLQFVGGANVSDDPTNNKTIIDLASAGGIDGVFVDTDNVIIPQSAVGQSPKTYTATEDCIMWVYLVINNNNASVSVDGNIVFYASSLISQNAGQTGLIPLKKGQTATITVSNYSDSQYKVYGIQTGTTHSKFQPVIYSLEEREIGVWTDGKPLYEKTVDCGALPNASTKDVAHNISNIDRIISIIGTAKRSDGDTFTPMPDLDASSVTTPNNYLRFWANVTNIRIKTSSDRSNYTSSYAILRYTKTTDVAGSGSWTPQGVPTHHYSTDEQVIGTYLGETLYRKVYTLSSPIIIVPGDSWQNTGINVTSLNIKEIIESSFGQGTTIWNFMSPIIDSGALKIINGGSIGNIGINRIILEYTKSS